MNTHLQVNKMAVLKMDAPQTDLPLLVLCHTECVVFEVKSGLLGEPKDPNYLMNFLMVSQ